MSDLPTVSALVNGQLESSINVFDRGLMYGDGLFETVRVVRGVAPLWRYHCRRLLIGCKRLRIAVSPDITQRLWEDLQAVVAHSSQLEKPCVVKIIITRGAGGRGYKSPDCPEPSVIVICYPYPEYPSHYAAEGVSVSLCRHRLSDNPALAGIKHLNRLDQVLASDELDSGVADGIMLDQRGAIIESTKANILFFDDEGVVSPATNLAGIDGVAREFIFDNLSKLNLRGRFDVVLPLSVPQFHGMAIVNSVAGVWPVRYFDGVELSISPMMRKIQHFFNEEFCFDRN